MPQDWRRDEIPDNDFDKVIGCQCLIGFGGIEKRFDRAGFDYFDVGVNPNPQDDIPDTFKDMSGGGLWKVLLSCPGKLQDLRVSDTILSGVIFYGLEEDHRVIILTVLNLSMKYFRKR